MDNQQQQQFFDTACNSGLRALEQYQYEEAISNFVQALDMKPDSEIYYKLGICYLNTNNMELAQQSFQSAVNLNDYDWKSYVQLGKFSNTIQLEPEHVTGILNRSLLYVKLKNYPKALLDLGKVEQILKKGKQGAVQPLQNRLNSDYKQFIQYIRDNTTACPQDDDPQIDFSKPLQKIGVNQKQEKPNTSGTQIQQQQQNQPTQPAQSQEDVKNSLYLSQNESRNSSQDGKILNFQVRKISKDEKLKEEKPCCNVF